jgi:hypothetical protein
MFRPPVPAAMRSQCRRVGPHPGDKMIDRTGMPVSDTVH